MKVVFELSGEHISLPISEVINCMLAENFRYEYIDIFGSFLLIETGRGCNLDVISKRLALSHFIDIYLFSSEPSENLLMKRAEETDININGSFRVRCENRSGYKINSIHLEKELGRVYARKNRVDLENPDEEIRLLISKDRWIVAKKMFEIERSQYEERKANYRPFFLPISMHPRLARCMVNLSRIRSRESLLDPFCGTGGILIEAGLIGAKVLGSDIQKWIVEGCKKNLDYYGISDYEIDCADVGEIEKFGKVDAVVADFPYGRASTTKKEPIESLYDRAFFSISNVLRNRKRLVCAIPDVELAKIGCNYLDLTEIHPFRIHGGLTRYICVYTK